MSFLTCQLLLVFLSPVRDSGTISKLKVAASFTSNINFDISNFLCTNAEMTQCGNAYATSVRIAKIGQLGFTSFSKQANNLMIGQFDFHFFLSSLSIEHWPI